MPAAFSNWPASASAMAAVSACSESSDPSLLMTCCMGLLEHRPGFLVALQPHQGHGLHYRGKGIAGIAFYGALVLGCSLIVTASPQQYVRQLKMHLGKLWVALYGGTKMHDGLLVVVQDGQHHPEAIMGLSIVRRNAQRLSELLN